MLARILFLLVLLMPCNVHGEELCGTPDYDSDQEPNFDCPSPGEDGMVPNLSPPPSVPVRLGDKVVAQWDGALVHRDRLIEMGLRVKAVRRLRWADRVRLTAEMNVRLTHRDEVCDARVEAITVRSQTYQDALAQANDRTSAATAWYRSWWFGFTLGIVAAGALVALAAYALSAI